MILHAIAVTGLFPPEFSSRPRPECCTQFVLQELRVFLASFPGSPMCEQNKATKSWAGLEEASVLYSYFDEMLANLILVQKGTLVCVFKQLHLCENDASCSWYCSTEFRHVILG